MSVKLSNSPSWCHECDHSIEDIGLLPNGDCPYCGHPINPPDEDVFFTAAPECYDYGHTHERIADTGYRHVSGMDTDKPIRMIAIDDDYHAQIQKDRNFSGLHPTLTSEEFTQWVHDGLLVKVER